MEKDEREVFVNGVQSNLHYHNHSIEYITPKKSSMMIDGEKLLDKINQLTTKPENLSYSAKMPTIKDFVIIKPISRGAFGKVFLGYKSSDHNKLYAIKVMRKSEMINKNMVSQVITERNALALSRSPFCVNLFYSLQSISYVYLVMEYMVGGDLKSLLAMYGYFDEPAARFYVAEVTLALQYLHEHGIVHRDIKPDNMLLSATGHIKLTDFGLSKIEMRRGDLEISDLINCSPNFNTRTPGQLLSLTSHLSFGSDKKLECTGTSNCQMLQIVNKHNTTIESDSDADTSLNEAEKTNDSKISGVSPFLSAEEINVSMPNNSNTASNNLIDSNSTYYTCGSSDVSKFSPSFNKSNGSQAKSPEQIDNNVEIKICSNGCKYDSNCNTICDKENLCCRHLSIMENIEFCMVRRRSNDERTRSSLKPQEDSGVSSRKSDYSNSNLNNETTSSSIDRADILCNSKDDLSSSDYSRSYNINNTNEISGIRMHSPFRKTIRNFKRPETLSTSLRGLKRKINMVNRPENSNSLEGDTNGSMSTGLTQEIEILDIGSSTPKKRKVKSPLRSVLKVRSLSDDEMSHIITENVTSVVNSTPVSSQKVPRCDGGLLGKLKATRFALPLSNETRKREPLAEKSISSVQYLKMVHDDSVMSPINSNSNSLPKTPKNLNTPFRTPKSVRRGATRQSSERILGTPDYLAPELLMRQGHCAAVDWWALGVCFYEFLTGLPPFNDETPQKVFENILSKNIEWPEGDEALTPQAVEAVDLLLTMDPAKRPSARQVQQMPFFASIQWKNIENEKPPFVPNPDDPTDTAYFEARNNMQHLKLSNFVFED
ncbi:serine/threonine-protein kinase greatwall isoform X1 [Glossina fuscipes]|uniref:Serine/threonine-protein kinase greatwall n=1 Tax=Glossina fuscipes TaxID=7396 RepID=A0A9C5YZ80_9MUSC|nr:serine/threonine-protein kinase greatwall isoform X1 [Glossina fuscipes]XP_037890781.1 serine/threonine-protein kinase greatwall isoform X1 [Glossina fuscipes]KAI9581146.1 hypothetical protein GQX74_011686 [Glossina fuscipes]